MTNMDTDKLPAIVKQFKDGESDVLVYNGLLYRPKDQEIIELCQDKDRNKNVTVILVTEGGDPDVAYRISRCLQDRYERFTCIVAGYCKSAGSPLSLH